MKSNYDQNRPLSYPCTDLFILAFSCISEPSMFNVRQKWIPEIRHHCANTPILLVSTKKDLRDDPIQAKNLLIRYQKRAIGYEQGEAMAKEMGCISYLETSAKTQEGLVGFSELIVKCVAVSGDTTFKPKSKKKCTLQ